MSRLTFRPILPNPSSCQRLSSLSYLFGSHGATWRIGSAQVQPYHTTECSISQSYDGDGALYLYTRIWAHKPGEPRRGIAKSTDVRNPSNLREFRS